MENKYYIPTIEDFYFGFEYEYMTNNCLDILEDTLGKWITEKFSCSVGADGESEFKDIEFLLDKGCVRVKCLNTEDLESEGWKKVDSAFGQYSLMINIF